MNIEGDLAGNIIIRDNIEIVLAGKQGQGCLQIKVVRMKILNDLAVGVLLQGGIMIHGGGH